jgi:hypothetical protein
VPPQFGRRVCPRRWGSSRSIFLLFLSLKPYPLVLAQCPCDFVCPCGAVQLPMRVAPGKRPSRYSRMRLLYNTDVPIIQLVRKERRSKSSPKGTGCTSIPPVQPAHAISFLSGEAVGRAAAWFAASRPNLGHPMASLFLIIESLDYAWHVKMEYVLI